MELDLHRQTEPLKQELRCMKDFSEDSLIACLDSWGYGYIDPKSIKFFFKQNQASLEPPLCAAIIRRFDLDGDSRLTHAEFIHGVTPLEPYSKVLVKEKIEARETLEKLRESIKVEAKKNTQKENGKGRNQGDKDEVTVQSFEKKMKSQEFLGTSPLRFRPLL